MFNLYIFFSFMFFWQPILRKVKLKHGKDIFMLFLFQTQKKVKRFTWKKMKWMKALSLQVSSFVFFLVDLLETRKQYLQVFMEFCHPCHTDFLEGFISPSKIGSKEAIPTTYYVMLCYVIIKYEI